MAACQNGREILILERKIQRYESPAFRLGRETSCSCRGERERILPGGIDRNTRRPGPACRNTSAYNDSHNLKTGTRLLETIHKMARQRLLRHPCSACEHGYS